MMAAWHAYPEIIIIFFGSILLGVIVGLLWARHSIRAPFRERRLSRRTLLQRIRWRLQHRMRPAPSHR